MLGEILRKRRESMGLTITQLSKRSGISPPALSNLETGRKTCYINTFLRISAAYGLDPHLLLDKIIEGNGHDKENRD